MRNTIEKIVITNNYHELMIINDCYHKVLLEDFFDIFILFKQFDIFYVKGNIQPRHIIKRQAEFIRRCVYLPHKSGHVVLPVLNDVN